jgi:hypothetical protein
MPGNPLADIHATPEQLREYYFSAIDPETRALTVKLAAARAAYRNAKKNPRIPTMRETEQPVPAYILARGDYTQPTEKVERETPDWLPPFPADQPRNRLGFAKWLTSPDHPLTARVMINRIWQEIFGTGIVETSDNFGLQGAQPSHPELLDWLARDLINHGWDHKRAINKWCSRPPTARIPKPHPNSASAIPPTLLARGPARRLTAEMLRDSALAHSGLLADTIGGPPAKPYQPAGSMWNDINNFLPKYIPDKGEGLYRRSLYTFWRRTTTPPNMISFDTTTRELCSTRRMPTNTPLQALVMLNDPQFVEAARKLGERILKEGGTTDESRANGPTAKSSASPPPLRKPSPPHRSHRRTTRLLHLEILQRRCPPENRRLTHRPHPRQNRSRHLHRPRPSPPQPRRPHHPALTHVPNHPPPFFLQALHRHRRSRACVDASATAIRCVHRR